jgi:lipoprotein YgeR
MKVIGKKRNRVINFIAVFALMAAVFCLPLFADSMYTVIKGDTLYSISRKYQITVGELRAANNLTENDILKTAQKLVIPSADIGTAAALSGTTVKNSVPADTSDTTAYIVLKGDTLYGIARRNNMKLPELMTLNNMTDTVLRPGEKLFIKNNTLSVSAPFKDANSAAENDDQPLVSADSLIVWPVKNPVVQNVAGKVSGVKLFTQKNETVKTIHSGTVMYVGTYRGFGKVVFVESKTGLIYAYTWLGSINVKKGDYVVYGDAVGTVGKDSETGKPFVSFMVFRNGMSVDPSRAPRG